MTLKVKPITSGKGDFVRPILESLPEWFGIYEATEHYIRTAEELDVLGCEDDQGPAGVLSLRRHFPETFEIEVLGVAPRCHGQGIGKAMIEAAAEHAYAKGATMLSVKTLGPSHADENYAATRAFYEAVGFTPVEEFKTLWSSGNPCLFMVKPV